MKNKKILIAIVEDDLIYLNNLQNILSKLNVEVITSQTSENGCYQLSIHKPDIIFLDKELPLLNGTKVISLYKDLSPASKIILMSSSFKMEDMAEAIQNKADYVIHKQDINETCVRDILEGYKNALSKNESLWNVLTAFTTGKSERKKKNIAVVEDDELFYFHLCWILNNNDTPHIVNSFSTADSFFDYIKISKPEIVFLDYSLPDMTGVEILTKVKTLLPTTKVIIISAQDNTHVTTEFTKIGINGYIIKNTEWKSKFNSYLKELDLA